MPVFLTQENITITDLIFEKKTNDIGNAKKQTTLEPIA